MIIPTYIIIIYEIYVCQEKYLLNSYKFQDLDTAVKVCPSMLALL